jgi:2-oxoacid:acceptor oxidoreductase delta subunit (pyruvate/2-ketoisovalerate family)
MELKTSGPAPVGKELYIVKTGEWRFQRPVVTIEKCTRCGICLIFCPVNAITEKENCYEANLEVCKGCGICANECHAGAVAMVMERRE